MRGVSVNRGGIGEAGAREMERQAMEGQKRRKKRQRSGSRNETAQLQHETNPYPLSRSSEEDHRPNQPQLHHRSLCQEDRRHGPHQDGDQVQDPMLEVLVHLVP